MDWTHSAYMSSAEDGTAVVVLGDDGWDALPFGMEGGTIAFLPLRTQPAHGGIFFASMSL